MLRIKQNSFKNTINLIVFLNTYLPKKTNRKIYERGIENSKFHKRWAVKFLWKILTNTIYIFY